MTNTVAPLVGLVESCCNGSCPQYAFLSTYHGGSVAKALRCRAQGLGFDQGRCGCFPDGGESKNARAFNSEHLVILNKRQNLILVPPLRQAS